MTVKTRKGDKACKLGTVYTDAVSFVTVTPFVYTAPVRVRYQNRVVLKTLSKVERFQNDTVSLVV